MSRKSKLLFGLIFFLGVTTALLFPKSKPKIHRSLASESNGKSSAEKIYSMRDNQGLTLWQALDRLEDKIGTREMNKLYTNQDFTRHLIGQLDFEESPESRKKLSRILSNDEIWNPDTRFSYEKGQSMGDHILTQAVGYRDRPGRYRNLGLNISLASDEVALHIKNFYDKSQGQTFLEMYPELAPRYSYSIEQQTQNTPSAIKSLDEAYGHIKQSLQAFKNEEAVPACLKDLTGGDHSKDAVTFCHEMHIFLSRSRAQQKINIFPSRTHSFALSKCYLQPVLMFNGQNVVAPQGKPSTEREKSHVLYYPRPMENGFPKSEIMSFNALIDFTLKACPGYIYIFKHEKAAVNDQFSNKTLTKIYNLDFETFSCWIYPHRDGCKFTDNPVLEDFLENIEKVVQ